MNKELNTRMMKDDEMITQVITTEKEEKPDIKKGDLVISKWLVQDWKRFTVERLLKTCNVMVVEDMKHCCEGDNGDHWSLALRFLNLDTPGNTTYISSANTFVNVTKKMGNIAQRFKWKSKFGV